MSLEKKIKFIYEHVKLGMEPYKAMLINGCSDEEIEQLNKDDYFQRRLELVRYEKEKELLALHDEAILTASEKGETKGIQWRLERLAPASYSKTVNNNIKADIQAKVSGELDINAMPEKEKERLSAEILEVLKSQFIKTDLEVLG
jgi:hypothetical protein